jgi:hypothetical protein
VRKLIVALGAVLSLGAIALSAGPASADFAGIPSVLHAGHALTAGTPNGVLDSPDGRFELSIFDGQAFLQQATPRPGFGPVVELWTAYGPNQRPRPGRSTLRMQRDGNLVLRAGDGHVNWSSRTAGTGSNNYLQVLSSGNVVIRTASGRTVWSTHTTPAVMVPGEHLASGRTLINRFEHNQPPTRLTMTRSGDLVLRHGTRRVWHSGTHAPGAHLTLRLTGGLAIMTRSGHPVWHSPALGRRTALEVSEGGIFGLIHSPRGCWQRPQHAAQRLCG